MASINMNEMRKAYIVADDDTYNYGNNTFEVEFCNKTYKCIEPYILKRKNGRVIKYYKSKHFFAVYKYDELIKIIKVQTCWSDDYILINLKDKIAYSYTQTAKGRMITTNEPCCDDYSDFIKEHGL